MHLVQLLLPTRDNDGRAVPKDRLAAVRSELTSAFGGVTAYSRAPAEGLWVDDDARVVRDDVVVFEVMVDVLDRDWWGRYRRDLERRFGQEELVIRATSAERL